MAKKIKIDSDRLLVVLKMKKKNSDIFYKFKEFEIFL